MNIITTLYDLGTEPHLIAKILMRSRQEVEEEVCDYESLLNDIERDYNENELPRVQKAIAEMKEEVSQFEKHEARRRYLLGQLQELKKEPDSPRLKKVMLDIKIFTGLQQGIDPSMVVKAREFPITQLVKSVRGMAKCPFHPDKSPSMDIRKNFYHCYGCGAQGDVIDFVMKQEGLTFKQAVTRLQ